MPETQMRLRRSTRFRHDRYRREQFFLDCIAPQHGGSNWGRFGRDPAALGLAVKFPTQTTTSCVEINDTFSSRVSRSLPSRVSQSLRRSFV